MNPPSVEESNDNEALASGTSPCGVASLCSHDHLPAITSSSGKSSSSSGGGDVDVDAMLRELARLRKDCADYAGGSVFEQTVATLITSVEKKVQFRKDLDRLKKSCREGSNIDGERASNDRFAPLLDLIETDSPGTSAKSSKSNKELAKRSSRSSLPKLPEVQDSYSQSTLSIQDEIRGLLVTNAELFYGCIASMEDEGKRDYGDDTDEDDDENDENQNCEVSFSRYGFDVIKVRTSGNHSQLATDADCTTEKFDMTPLAQLPPGLNEFIIPQHKSEPFSRFINYEAIFESALLFRDEVLETFLPKLRDHLMLVQICLRGVDNWLKGSSMNIGYISKTFGITLATPDESDYCGTTCTCPPKTHPASYICFACQCPFSFHKDGRCPKGKTMFNCKKFHLLKNFEGRVRVRSFEIGKVKDQVALEKFLVSMERRRRESYQRGVSSTSGSTHRSRSSLKSAMTPKSIDQRVAFADDEIINDNPAASTPHSTKSILRSAGEPMSGDLRSKDTPSTTELSSMETMESGWDKSNRRWGRFSFKGFSRKSSKGSSQGSFKKMASVGS